MDQIEPTVEPQPAAADLDDADLDRPIGGPHLVRWVAVTVFVVVVVAFTVVVWNRYGTDASLVDSPLIGRPAPEFALPALDAESETGPDMVRSADLSGRLYVVNFWASWCVPCRQEASELERFYQQWSPQGIELVGIVYNDNADDAREFRGEFGLTYPQAMDPDGLTATDFGVFGVPETFVVDPRGVVMAKLIGAVGPGTLDEVVAQVLAGETYTAQNDQYRTSPG